MKKIVLALFVLLCSLPAFAWWNTGHEIVAQIAWDNLTPKTKQAVTALLQEPINYPGNQYLTSKTSGFVSSSVWSDDIKETPWKNDKDKDFYFNLHFIDTKTTLGQNSAEKTIMKNYNEAYKSSNGDNVVAAIKSSEKVLSNTAVDDTDRAIALRFLIHCVGDLHQPLHASDPYLNGKSTMGGNTIALANTVYIPSEKNPYAKLMNGQYMETANELHALWDGMGGVYKQLADPAFQALTNKETNYLEMISKTLENNYGNEKHFQYLVSIPNPTTWAIITNKIAIKAIQDTGATPRYNFEKNSNSKNTVMYNTDSYLDFVKSQSKMQLFVAGKRLANTLNAIFDPTHANQSYVKFIADNIVSNANITNIYQLSSE